MAPPVNNRECKDYSETEDNKIKQARLLYPDWGAMEAARIGCVAVDDEKVVNAEGEGFFDLDQLEEERKAAEKAAKEAEKAAKEAEKDAQKQAEELEKQQEEQAKEAEKAAEELAEQQEKEAEELAKQQEKDAEELARKIGTQEKEEANDSGN